MFETLRNAWRVKEIRMKICYTIMIIFIFRIGSFIPVPFVDAGALRDSFAEMDTGAFFSYLNILTGGAMNYGALFAMSITPYINASIIMQLLTVAIPHLERLAQEGQEGQKKIAKYTRFATVILGLIQGAGFWFWLHASGFIVPRGEATSFNTFDRTFAAVVIILCFTAGSALMMWLGERIDERGIGNGISILLFAGIISAAPNGAAYLWFRLTEGQYVLVPIIVLVLLAVIVFIVWMQFAERRIPIQYAKRVVGRKQMGGQATHMPIKVNMSGVMPIIFATSILTIPQQVLGFMNNPAGAPNEGFWFRILSLLDYQSLIYAAIYFGFIIAFAFFYTSIQYNPVEMANNLRKNNGAIPGIRPGKPTQLFIKNILSRITLIGAIFLGIVAVLPIVLGQVANIRLALGGTSMLIVIGVAIEAVQQLESQMMMRHYKGFLD